MAEFNEPPPQTGTPTNNFMNPVGQQREYQEWQARKKAAEQDMLTGQRDAAGAFANDSEAAYRQRQAMLDANFGRMRDVSRGGDSISAENLRQGLQRSMAQNQAMGAARGGRDQRMMQMRAAGGQASVAQGLGQQQARQGIAERGQMQEALTKGLAQTRGQDIQAGLGSRGLAVQGEISRLGYERPFDWGPWVGAGASTLAAWNQGSGGNE